MRYKHGDIVMVRQDLSKGDGCGQYDFDVTHFMVSLRGQVFTIDRESGHYKHPYYFLDGDSNIWHENWLVPRNIFTEEESELFEL